MAPKKASRQALLEVDEKPDPPPNSSTSPNRLRLHRLIVKNYAGFIEETIIDFDPRVTVVRGRNATKKSSILSALRCVLGIDRQAASRRAHIDPVDGSVAKPELEAVLLGEDREIHVRRVGDGSPEVRERVGEDWRQVPRPGEWLRDLVDVQGANPQLFLDAKDEDKAAMILEAIDLPSYSREEALRAAGMEGFRLPPIPEGLHPLEDLEKVMAAIFSSRTEVNAQERRESDAAKKLLQDLPAEPPGDITKAVAQGEAGTSHLASEIDRETMAAGAALNEVTLRVEASFKSEAAALRSKHQQKAAELRAATEKRIAELLAETETAIDTIRTRGEGELEHAEAARVAVLEAIAAKGRTLATLREKLAGLRAQQTNIETDRRLRATAKEARTAAETHKARADELTAGLEALKRYRAQLAGSLPFKGLEVSFDEKGKTVITLDRIPIDQVNTGRLKEFADEVTLLRGAAPSGDRPFLPLVLVDWIESIDDEARARHLQALAARGAQVVAALVQSSPLEVRHGDAALAVA